MITAVRSNIGGLITFECSSFYDNRGYFREIFRSIKLESILGRPCTFVQDNESCSRLGVVRGLHFQRPPHAQAKLVRVSHGRAFDVAVDLRPGSSTYGKWATFDLSAENGRQVFIPEGFAHGFMAMEDDTVICYKVNDYYAPECDAGIRWNDPTIGVDWPNSISPIISLKDSQLPLFNSSNFTFWADM